MNIMLWIWLAAAVVFGAVEAATAGLVSSWFVAGAVAAFLGALADLSVLVQLCLFVAVSALALVLTRPLVRKVAAGKAVATNADRVLGQEAKVTETIDNANAAGAVYADGKTWSARSLDGSVIPAGEMVRIQKIEGVKLFVEKIKVMEGIN